MSIKTAEELLLRVAEKDFSVDPRTLFATVLPVNRPGLFSGKVAYVPGNKNRHLVLMVEAEYRLLSDTLSELKAVPEKVSLLFPGADRMVVDGPISRVSNDFRRPAFLSSEGIACFPWQSVVFLREWLSGRNGRHGGSASNAIVKRFNKEEPSPSPIPPPREVKPVQYRLRDQAKADAALKRLGLIYELVMTSNDQFPTAKDVEMFGANTNIYADGLEEDMETLWIIEEDGFYAVICGPVFGESIERMLRSSFLKFRMPTTTLGELKQGGVEQLLKREDPLGSGWCLVRTRGGKVIATLTTLRRFCEQIGVR